MTVLFDLFLVPAVFVVGIMIYQFLFQLRPQLTLSQVALLTLEDGSVPRSGGGSNVFSYVSLIRTDFLEDVRPWQTPLDSLCPRSWRKCIHCHPVRKMTMMMVLKSDRCQISILPVSDG